MDIKLIALDLDGTTLNSAKRISDSTCDALEAAAAQGVHIVVATGRPYDALPSAIFDIDAIRYVITSNGAAITDLKTGENFYENCLSPQTVEAAVDVLDHTDYILEVFVILGICNRFAVRAGLCIDRNAVRYGRGCDVSVVELHYLHPVWCGTDVYG